MSGFIKFLREQGVVGLAIGFLLGGAVSKLVAAFVTDIINPIIGMIIGRTEKLASASFHLGGSEIMWGHFITVLIDFLIVALVVYYGFKKLKLEKLDTKKE